MAVVRAKKLRNTSAVCSSQETQVLVLLVS